MLEPTNCPDRQEPLCTPSTSTEAKSTQEMEKLSENNDFHLFHVTAALLSLFALRVAMGWSQSQLFWRKGKKKKNSTQ